MTPCDQPGCPGVFEETGFCDICGHRATPARSRGADNGSTFTQQVTQTGSDSELLSLPVFEFPDPASRVQSDPHVPERDRTCPHCHAAVGRARGGHPAMSKGFCGRCGEPFSFLPSLQEGDLVENRYKVTGCIARGGLGWVYLARDTNLNDNWVVLKGLIDVADAPLARAELRALVMMDHPNIVRVHNFVTHPNNGGADDREYIVMEYVDGFVLSDVRRQSASGKTPLGEPLLVEHVLKCGLQILTAFDYLHGRELLYCDMKPDNVIIRSGQHGERLNRVKLIDLGAVRKTNDRTSKIVITKDYQVGEAELDERGLTVGADIHTLGVTLDELFAVTADRAEELAGGSDVAAGLESFHRLVKRATHEDPDQRFATAAQMAEQLTGVYREIAALRDAYERPALSTVFAPSAVLLDNGLGAVPPLDHWLPADELRRATAAGVPHRADAVASLPQPLPEPDDPAAGPLTSADATDPRWLLDKLPTYPADSVAVQLARCRAHLELGDVGAAQASIDVATTLLGRAAAQDWRKRWHEGLIALVTGELGAAENAFDAVYDVVPGELAPKLALGYCAEARGRGDDAERFYRAVWRRDRLQTSAAFGLVRLRLAKGDRAGALQVLAGVPKVSRHADAAGIAIVTVYCGAFGSGAPTEEELAAAARRLPKVYLDGGEDHGHARDRLTALVRAAGLDWIREHERPLPIDGGTILGQHPGEAELGEKLEESYRALARQAGNADDHDVLLDRANRTRQVTFW